MSIFKHPASALEFLVVIAAATSVAAALALLLS
jgi:hypothetical protein